MSAAPHTLGKYELIAELGHGGMADVFLAMIGGPTGSGFTKLAVVKRLRPNLVEDPEFVAMLVDEARISARLNHPNVVQTLEVGVEHEEYYLAMEFLEGQPLHRIQRRAARTGIPIPRDLEYLVIADTLAGLHHAHELADYDGTPLGIVHRDVTPQNVFVTYDGTVKVVDFGIAKAAGRASETKQGIVKGKVRYMSPEQAMGGAVDRRTDIFAAGILLWGAATGRRFWGDIDDLGVVQALVGGNFDPSPRAVDPMVPFEIDAMCRKALACNPDERYATAAEFLTDLEAFLADHIVSARRRLGAFLATSFRKERAELRTVIERASRRERSVASVALLMGSSSHHSAAPGATPASLAPFNLSPRVSAPAPTLQPAPRFGSGSIIAAAAMLAASIVLLTQLGDRIGSAPAAASAEANVVQRETTRAVEARTDLVIRSTPQKRVGEPRVFAPPPPVAVVFVPVAPSPRPTVAAAPPTAAPAAPPRATASPAEPRQEGRRRAQPAIDKTDPWGTPDP